MCKKDYSWNPSTCICENGISLKRIADTSVIVMKLLMLPIVYQQMQQILYLQILNQQMP